MIQLHEIPTRAPKGLEKEDIKRKTDRLTRRIGELQHIMYAGKKQNLPAKSFHTAILPEYWPSPSGSLPKKNLHMTFYGESVNVLLQKE